MSRRQRTRCYEYRNRRAIRRIIKKEAALDRRELEEIKIIRLGAVPIEAHARAAVDDAVGRIVDEEFRNWAGWIAAGETPPE